MDGALILIRPNRSPTRPETLDEIAGGALIPPANQTPSG